MTGYGQSWRICRIPTLGASVDILVISLLAEQCCFLLLGYSKVNISSFASSQHNQTMIYFRSKLQTENASVAWEVRCDLPCFAEE